MWSRLAIFSLLIAFESGNFVLSLSDDHLQRSNSSKDSVLLSATELIVNVNETKEFIVYQKKPMQQNVTLMFEEDYSGHIDMDQKEVQLHSGILRNHTVTIYGLKPGTLILTAIFNPSGVINDKTLFIRVTVVLSKHLIYLSIIVGWGYFLVWSITFYPQCWTNFRRKSVVGLSFDYMAINVIGHVTYAIFNSAFYWIPTVQDSYFDRFPSSHNPVKLNDVVFALHASVLSIFTVIQCFIYDSGNQEITKKTWAICGFFGIAFLATLVLAGVGVIEWLDFLYTCSYIKLATAMVKYIPQMYLNYVRKSTEGWSIAQVLLDFAGGILSILQMIFDAANFNDWISIFGDPTKFWLGVVSMGFCVVFIVQHYCLYRHTKTHENTREFSSWRDSRRKLLVLPKMKTQRVPNGEKFEQGNAQCESG